MKRTTVDWIKFGSRENLREEIGSFLGARNDILPFI